MKVFIVVAKDRNLKSHKKCFHLLILFNDMLKSHEKKKEKKPKIALNKMVVMLTVTQDNYDSSVDLHTSILRH